MARRHVNGLDNPLQDPGELDLSVHQDLQYDLSRHLRSDDRMVMVEVNLGSRVYEGFVGQADVMTIDLKYHHMNFTIYEVKASTSDLRKDLDELKFKRYIPFSDRLFFALGPEVSKAAEAEIPEYIGIIRRGPKGWRATRKARINGDRQPFDNYTWGALLFHQYKLTQRFGIDSRLDRLVARRERLEKAKIAQSLDHLRGIVGIKLKDLVKREQDVERKVADAELEAWRSVGKALGLDSFWPSGATSEEKAVHLLEAINGKMMRAITELVKGQLLEHVIDAEIRKTAQQIQEERRQALKDLSDQIGKDAKADRKRGDAQRRLDRLFGGVQ